MVQTIKSVGDGSFRVEYYPGNKLVVYVQLK